MSLADIRATVLRTVDDLDVTQQAIGILLLAIEESHAQMVELEAESTSIPLAAGNESLVAIQNVLIDAVGYAEDAKMSYNGYLRGLGLPGSGS